MVRMKESISLLSKGRIKIHKVLYLVLKITTWILDCLRNSTQTKCNIPERMEQLYHPLRRPTSHQSSNDSKKRRHEYSSSNLRKRGRRAS